MPSLNLCEVNARPIFNRTIFNRPIVPGALLALVVFLSLFVFSLRPAIAQMTGGHAATNSFGSAAQPATGAFAGAAGSGRLATGPVITPTAPMHASTAPANSTGPNAVNSRVTFSTGRHTEDHHRHHDRDDDDSRGHAYPIYGYAYPYAVEPYAGDESSPADNPDAESDADYQGGPTIFDRRGSGEDSYIPLVEDVSNPHSGQLIADTTPQAATLLVFKDGHKIEVENYAIVGATLFDLTPGHARRVALASLDLDATRQQNEDRGVIFQLPGTLPGN